jgi:hypothetical protein
MNKEKLVQYFIIGTFVSLYIIVSVISTIHVIDFFKLSNPEWLAISLAIAFEIGAAASLASLITLDKMNKALIWALFIILTLMQMMGNAYYAYVHLENYQAWIELFGLVEEEAITQKRILAIISGAILPIVALGFIKSLVDYIKPSKTKPEQKTPIKEITDKPAPVPTQVLMDVEPNPTQIIIEEENETEISEEEYREIINEMLKTENAVIDVNENADINLVEESAPETVETLEPIIDSTPEDVAEIKTSPAPMNPQVRPGVN